MLLFSRAPCRILTKVIAYAYAGEQHARASILRAVSSGIDTIRHTHLVADDGQELPIFVLRCGGRHYAMCREGSCREVGAWAAGCWGMDGEAAGRRHGGPSPR